MSTRGQGPPCPGPRPGSGGDRGPWSGTDRGGTEASLGGLLGMGPGAATAGSSPVSAACPSVSQDSPFRVGSVRGRGIDFSFFLELLLAIRGQVGCDMSRRFRGWEHEVLIGYHRVCKGDENPFRRETEQGSNQETFQITPDSALPASPLYTRAHSATRVTPPRWRSLAWVRPRAGGRGRGNGNCDLNHGTGWRAKK